MSNKDYKKLVIEKLLKKYNNRIAKHINTTRRIILEPKEVYKNYTDNNADIMEKQSFNEAMAGLSDMEMITVDLLKFSTDIEKVYLCEEKMETVYEFLKDEYGIIPQGTILKRVQLLIQQYNTAGKLVRNYCDNILLQLEDPRIQIDSDRVEANLKMLDFMEKNEENLYVREASMLVYGDSKWFEQNNYDEVCTIARDTLGMLKEETERNDTVLSHYHIAPAEQEIFIKGNWKIEWDDHVLDIAKLTGGIALTTNDIQDIRQITIRSFCVITIENKTSYQRMGSRNMASIYLGGFANRHQIQFLLKVIEDNPDITYYHFGDIDVGGFLIHRHLCKATSTDFMLYCMGIEQLADERFKESLRALTDNDVSRMNLLLEETPYSPIVKYMKEHNVKLEQEIVSYFLAQKDL